MQNTCVRACVRACVHACVRACVRVSVCLCACACVHVCVCARACVRACVSVFAVDCWAFPLCGRCPHLQSPLQSCEVAMRQQKDPGAPQHCRVPDACLPLRLLKHARQSAKWGSLCPQQILPEWTNETIYPCSVQRPTVPRPMLVPVSCGLFLRTPPPFYHPVPFFLKKKPKKRGKSLLE